MLSAAVKNAPKLKTEIASNNQSRALGLSGRVCIPDDTAMLFSFPDSDTRCFWMKDMRFPIDMIWVNANDVITHVEQGVKPASYPESYCGSGPAQSVIEVGEGMAARYGLTPGVIVNF